MFCNWISWVSEFRYESWHDATIQSWLMQRLNIVVGTRYTLDGNIGSLKQPSHEKVFEVSELFNTNQPLRLQNVYKARHLGFKKKCNSTVREMRTKALVITQLICAFVFSSINEEGTSRQRSGKGASFLIMRLQNPRNLSSIKTK